MYAALVQDVSHQVKLACDCMQASKPFPHKLQEEELQEEEAKEALEDSSEASEIKFQLSCAGLQVSTCTVVHFVAEKSGLWLLTASSNLAAGSTLKSALPTLAACGCSLPALHTVVLQIADSRVWRLR